MTTIHAIPQSAAELTETLDELRTLLPVGSTVTTILMKTNRTGDRHWVKVLAVGTDGEILRISYLVVKAGIGKLDLDEQSVVVTGGGMDMAYDIVHSLSRALYGDGRQLTHRAL